MNCGALYGETAMLELSDRLPKDERASIAEALFDYLKALPILE